MQKIVVCLALSVLFVFGCSSMGSGKLSEFDQLTIIDMARYTITRQNSKFVSAEEAAFINKQMPEVKIRYSAPREGKMLISWSLKNKNVNFVYSGKFLSDSAMWQMSIIKHHYKISKKKINALRKRKKIRVTDFDDLRKR